MVIRVVDIVDGANTGDQGHALYLLLHSAMSKPDAVVLSFAGVQVATSSFVNAAFVELLADYNFAAIRAKLRIVDSTRQINDMIRSRLSREAEKVLA